MTNRQIDALTRLDELIQEHVYGWTYTVVGGVWVWSDGVTAAKIHTSAIPHYSTDIALAIGVLEKLRLDRGWNWMLVCGQSIQIRSHAKENRYPGMTPLPEAICRHVLHVLGVEVGSD